MSNGKYVPNPDLGIVIARGPSCCPFEGISLMIRDDGIWYLNVLSTPMSIKLLIICQVEYWTKKNALKCIVIF
jgi:hypothetical protein